MIKSEHSPGPEGIDEDYQNLLNWARENNCIFSDFVISSEIYDDVLYRVGFINQTKEISSICNIPTRLTPITYGMNINLAYSVNEGVKYCNFDWPQTYIVRSDGDQDRPSR